MTGTATKRQREETLRGTSSGKSDERLIEQCLGGDQKAWSALIDKYKNLIYSIPIRYGMYQDAGDIFQAVCVDLLVELPKIRERRALPKWLMQNCYRKCLHYQRSASRHVELDPSLMEQQPDGDALPEEMMAQLEKEQTLRDVIAELPSRCQKMIHMLFFELPARSYQEVARTLGLAIGSIGFIRGRCMSRLKKHLVNKGF